MTSLDSADRSHLVKALVLGDSGGGKTAALASLAAAGYKLFIIDFDNGTDILRDPTVLAPECRKNIDVEVCTDKMRGSPAGPILAGTPKAMRTAMTLLNNWNDEVKGVETWGDDKVLVIDSLTMMGEAAMNYVLAVNGRVGQSPYQSDWGEAMKIQENLLKQLYSSEVKCHVIVNCHVKFMDADQASDPTLAGLKGYPMALGRQLPPKIGRYFNNIFFVQAKGSGSSVRRIIRTNSTPQVELKNARPSLIAPEYNTSDGMALIFEAIRSE